MYRFSKRSHPLLVALVILIPAAGYGIMHLLAYAVPLDQDSTGMHLLVTLAIIALGLMVPYWMLKAGFFRAHLRNRDEDELHLRDLPKDGHSAGKQDLV